jgi:3-hydroxyisobutyrate dehydrogenase
MKVGFIGLGQMGGPLAKWILDAGFPLVVHDIRKDAATPLLESGAIWADTPGDVAEQCNVVATCLPGPVEMEAATMGREGILQKIRPGAIYIDHTTNSPELVRTVGSAIANRNAKMLDIPLDGGREGALAGDLTLFAGGDQAALRSVRPVLDSFSSDVVWVGELGTGSVTKIVHNALAMSMDLLITECLTLGAKGGVELPRLIDAFRRGSILGGSITFLKRMPQTLFRGDFSPRFALKLACKDYGLASDLSKRYEVPTQLIDMCERELSEALGRGWGEQDRTIASTLQEERANVKLRLTSP